MAIWKPFTLAPTHRPSMFCSIELRVVDEYEMCWMTVAAKSSSGFWMLHVYQFCIVTDAHSVCRALKLSNVSKLILESGAGLVMITAEPDVVEKLVMFE